MSRTLVQNVDADQACPICGDDGWVELRGTVHQHGVEYERGMAPCNYCQRGARNAERQDRRGSRGYVPLERAYEMKELMPPIPHHEGGAPFAEYLGTDQGRADPHAAVLEEMLAGRVLVKQVPRVDESVRPLPAPGPGAFLAAAGDSIAESTEEEAR